MSLKMRFLPRCLYVKTLKSSVPARVLLTFDDGPHPKTTPRVLDLLRRYDARAIFFVIGSRIHRAPDMLLRIVTEGHLVGNHTYTHALDRQFGFHEYKADLIQCEDIIRQHAPESLRYHRPPEGTISVATAFAPKSLGLRTVLWSVEGGDWSLRNADEALKRARHLVNVVQPRDIICFHDEQPYIVELLEDLLPKLQSRGLRFDVELEAAL